MTGTKKMKNPRHYPNKGFEVAAAKKFPQNMTQRDMASDHFYAQGYVSIFPHWHNLSDDEQLDALTFAEEQLDAFGV